MQRALLQGAAATVLAALCAASWAADATAGTGTRLPAGATNPAPGSDPTNPNGSAMSAGTASEPASGAATRTPPRHTPAASTPTR
jgi:hypothetical protein